MAKTALGTKVTYNPGHTYIIIPEFPKAQLNQKAYYYLPSPTAPPWIGCQLSASSFLALCQIVLSE